MQPLPSAIITCLFLLCGIAATLLMLKRLGGRDTPPDERQIFWHRIFGWTFAAAFALMLVTMFTRFYAYWEEDPARVVFHYTGAFALATVLLLKISIPRLYPGFKKHLFPLGVTVLFLAFVSTAGALAHYLVRMTQRAPYISHSSISSMPDVELGKLLFIERCRTCHPLDSILKPRTAESWEKIIAQMTKLAFPRIRPDEAKQILYYLVETRTPKKPVASTGYPLLDEHCTTCHEPDEIFAKVRTRKEWEAIVSRMTEDAPDIVPQDRLRAIVDEVIIAQEKALGKSGPDHRMVERKKL